MIKSVEKFRIEKGKLPNDVSEIGIKEDIDSPAYYSKETDSTYKVWYAIGFESNVYYSEKQQWKEEG